MSIYISYHVLLYTWHSPRTDVEDSIMKCKGLGDATERMFYCYKVYSEFAIRYVQPWLRDGAMFPGSALPSSSDQEGL